MKENSKIQQLRKIVKNHTAGEVDGQMVDAFSASAILNLYDALKKPEAKEKLLSLPVIKMASVAFKLLTPGGAA